MSRNDGFRRRLGQVALAVAALAAIATSPAPVLETSRQANSITLDSARAVEVRRFVVRLRAGEDPLPDKDDFDDSLSVQLAVHRLGSDFEAATSPHRIVRVRFERIDAPEFREQRTITTADVGSSEGHLSHPPFGSCSDWLCEGEFELIFELLDPTMGGPVVVDWSVGVHTSLDPDAGTLELDFNR